MTTASELRLYTRHGNYIPRVAAVHDLCGYGKCSLGIAIPVLSAAGSGGWGQTAQGENRQRTESEESMGFRTYTCPIARSCGGCEWLAVPYPIQLRRKREAVVELFSDVLAELPTSETRGRQVPIHGMDVDGMEPVHFRHKAATPFAPGSGEAIRSGFYARGTHRIVPCADCLVEAPGARRVLSAVARAAEELRIPAYEEDRGRGLLRHAVVRMGFATNECLLTVVTNGRGIACEREFVQHILTHAPEVTAIAQNVNQRRTNAILGRETLALYGGGHMVDQLLDVSFEIGPTSFYQTNPAQTEVLYDLAIRGAGLEGGMHVLDAYCGIGTIGLCAASRVDGLRVVGVEQVEGAVADARANAARNTPEFLHGVLGLVPERVVYISCNPVTQRRDIDVLMAGGYRLESLDVVDMFPHTKHAETVAVLRRR